MKAFVTGSNKDYVDILDWFLEGYHKHIKIPLYIANFGMLKNIQMKSWLQLMTELGFINLRQ